METQISFGANFIRKMPVKVYSYNHKSYKPAEANLVELNPLDINDLNALEDTARNFGGDTLANNVYIHANSAFLRGKAGNIQLLALTKQGENFQNLNADDILGVAEISLSKTEPSWIELKNLQVRPQYTHSSRYQHIKNIGTAIVNYLKETYKKIELNSSSSGIRFYEKLGFKRQNSNRNIFIWTKD